MTSAFDKLTKILSLERDQGYRDRAVIGGLERFLSLWHEKAKGEVKDTQQVQLVEEIVSTLQGYAERDRQGRRGIINQILTKLGPEERGGETVPSKGDEPAGGPPQNYKGRPPAGSSGVPEALEEGPRPGLDAPVTRLSGVSATYAKRLQRLGITTIRDLLYHIPRRYDDFSALKTINQLEYGEEVTIIGTIWETRNRETRRGVTLTTSTIADGTGTIQATWFNQPYLVTRLKPGRQIVISGQVDQYLGRLVFQSPEWEPLEKELIHTGRLVPVYPLTKGIGARWLRRLMKRSVDYWAQRLPEHLPSHVRERACLLDLQTAISQIHFPDSEQMLQQARRRLCFDEFFLIQVGVLRQRRNWQMRPGRAMTINRGLLDSFLSSLPFSLTDAQGRALEEILDDMQSPQPMSRLLQGDVGSGKTVVAAAAMLMTVANGYQAAIMAPTEILAEQHYKTISELLANCKLQIAIRLLTGSLRPAEKEEIHRQVAAGEADIIVGTHALIQEAVDFKELGLAVIDEQHRFGVRQRATLRQKGITETRKEAETRKQGEEFRDLRPPVFCPHILVMSATPIPRTLALTIYGDLDIAAIDQLPPGRQEIITKWLLPRERERAYNFVRGQVEKGRQAFVICPLIEESEKLETKAATAEYERLQNEIFPDLRLGLLHGRMKAKEKEATMESFRRGDFDILVSTPVVEVGIDVPNATVMLVEGADRFGLAQLHQFRGRVGRGEKQSYCLLLADSPTIDAEERLKTIESTQDGFLLAEEDLKLRGPGEFFGTRQSGLPDLKVAKLSDVKILERARAEALEVFRRDPDLSLPEHALLAQKVEEFWRGEGDLS